MQGLSHSVLFVIQAGHFAYVITKLNMMCMLRMASKQMLMIEGRAANMVPPSDTQGLHIEMHMCRDLKAHVMCKRLKSL